MADHALGSEAKAARRLAILAAARELFLAGDGGLPSAAEIARAALLAKGTVYLYFRTKEEIFAALLLSGWRTLLKALAPVLQAEAGDRTEIVPGFLAIYVGHLRDNPELLRLDALGYGVLEKNLALEALRDFKLAFMDELDASGRALDRSAGLPDGRGVELLTRTYALTRGLWQMLDYPQSLASLEDAPSAKPSRAAFETELMTALREYWAGALISSPQPPVDAKPGTRAGRPSS